MSFELSVAKRLGDRLIRAEFTAGEGLTALFGSSGAGKTSILNMIAGLLTPDQGRIAVAGALLFDQATGLNLPPERRRAGYVFQDLRLFAHQRVRDNFLYGWRLADPAARWLEVDRAVALLGLGKLLDRWPATLSGGEARRVAVGRALLAGPRFLLMDEPLSALDPARREEIMQLIERVRDELRLPILYVSHDRAELDRLASRVINL
jgi:molybdate transport system ATP-binding protein